VSFSIFWSSYPKKVGKGAALKVWTRLKPNPELQSRIHAAIAQQLETDQWQRDNGQFIPHPATWLNQTRWEDETATVQRVDPIPGQPVDWWEDCKRIHNGECELDRMRHHIRCQIEQGKAG
jgi:hypothetical protein